MAITFHVSSVAAEPLVNGVERQRLLTQERVAGTNILLDRLTFAAGASFEFAVPGQSLAWFQMLAGEARITHAQGSETLSDAHVVFLPPGFRGR